jgi:hypothetical protein
MDNDHDISPILYTLDDISGDEIKEALANFWGKPVEDVERVICTEKVNTCTLIWLYPVGGYVNEFHDKLKKERMIIYKDLDQSNRLTKFEICVLKENGHIVVDYEEAFCLARIKVKPVPKSWFQIFRF